MSHDFFSCYAPLPPGLRCGEHRGGLSSREPGAESLKQHKAAAAESADLIRWSEAKDIDEAERNLRSGFPYCGYKEWQPAGSIGFCGGSYCRRASFARGGAGQQPNYKFG